MRNGEHLPDAPEGGSSSAAAASDARLTLAYAALGVVYGDIGTSPLYALRACFNVDIGGVSPTPPNVYGVLSLILWSLILVVTVKYLVFILRADNRGEGGILALMALASTRRPRRSGRRTVLITLGLFGAALLYGDGMIMPAITVLGAVEGLGQAAPVFERLVLPISIGVLIGIFALQRRGTAAVAALFSPVTLIWFASIAVLGAVELVRAPNVLGAINPLHAVRFFSTNGLQAFLVLGSVFLVVTGAEAMYADMGHFGRAPIQRAWLGLVLPALVLNYLGQGALLLREPAAAANPFYSLVPSALLLPMVIVATAAAIVASQALISGAFSLTRQALQLGYVPRMEIVHTSGEREGQIYVPSVNRALALGCIALVLGFGSSDSLAGAYGIAVAATMTITTLLFYVVARHRFGWGRAGAAALACVFLVADLAFLGANLTKIADGGWFPLAVAALVYLLMATWWHGRTALADIGGGMLLPLQKVVEEAQSGRIPRVAGAGVFMNPAAGGAPLVLLHHLKHNQVLHETVVVLSMITEEVPTVDEADRVTTVALGEGFYEVRARNGFMETPNAPDALELSEELKGKLPPQETTYYLGRQTLVPTGPSRLPGWRKRLFRVLYRNARPATVYFGLPPGRVVELGAQVPL
ncbi:MAG: KUP/HAK/KT family potassium transporter [Gemmatimonadetes bacterium]|nr:KUP/HAK/KT family potassium transporter [Gemmatimonadota bacterium]MBA3556593.1 KUP/HAK/KT family potassium transporter [Gemmatimonadales bacterium]